MDKEAPKNPLPSGTVGPDPLARAAALLEEELEATHQVIENCFASGHTDYERTMMSATVALAGALVRLKGGTRQRVIVERVGGEGGTPKNRKTNGPAGSSA